MVRAGVACGIAALPLAAVTGCTSDKPSPRSSSAPTPDKAQLDVARRTLSSGPTQSSGSEVVSDGVHIEDGSVHSGQRLEFELACTGSGRLTIKVRSGKQHASEIGHCAASPARITVPVTAGGAMRLDVSGPGSGVIAWQIRRR